MAIHPLTAAALRILSYPDLNIRKHYRLERTAKRLLHPAMKFLWHTWDHRVIREGHEIPVRVFIPAEMRSREIFLFFHGGGWVSGNMDSYTAVCGALARAMGRRVLSVDYRLAPEHRFPSGLEDCYAAARDLFAQCAKSDSPIGATPEEVILMGDSAGGNLAAAVSLMAAERGEFLPRRQVLIYPALQNDFGHSSPFSSVHEYRRGYLLSAERVADYLSLYMQSEADLKNPLFSPLLAPDLRGQPNTLMITAACDPLRDEGEAYAARLAEAGVPVTLYRAPDVLHGFFSLPPVFSAVRDIYRQLALFLGDPPITDEKESTQKHE